MSTSIPNKFYLIQQKKIENTLKHTHTEINCAENNLYPSKWNKQMILFQLLNVFHLDFISFFSANNELSSILGRSGRRIILNMHSNEPRVLVPAFRVS